MLSEKFRGVQTDAALRSRPVPSTTSWSVNLVSSQDVDELGPVDYLVVEFPPGAANFSGEMAAEIGRLVDAKVIRVLDLLILQKAADGTIEALEIDDLDQVDELRVAETQLGDCAKRPDGTSKARRGVRVWLPGRALAREYRRGPGDDAADESDRGHCSDHAQHHRCRDLQPADIAGVVRSDHHGLDGFGDGRCYCSGLSDSAQPPPT
jgi:hypothetical protein